MVTGRLYQKCIETTAVEIASIVYIARTQNDSLPSLPHTHHFTPCSSLLCVLFLFVLFLSVHYDFISNVFEITFWIKYYDKITTIVIIIIVFITILIIISLYNYNDETVVT